MPVCCISTPIISTIKSISAGPVIGTSSTFSETEFSSTLAMMVYTSIIMGHATPTTSSSNRLISSCDMNKELNSSRSRLQGFKLHSPTSHSRHSLHVNKFVRCSLPESTNGHENFTSIWADASDSIGWQPSNSVFVQESTTSILSTDDVIIPNIDALTEPLMFLPVERTLLPADEKKLGLGEENVRRISKHNDEPEWMLQFRLDAFHQLLAMEEPHGAKCPPIDFHAYLSVEADLKRQSGQPQELVENGGSFATTHNEALSEAGVIFCSMSEAIRDHPELVRKYLGKVVPPSDNFYAALNSAVFLHGSFCYVPENVTCPMDISTYFLVDGRKMTSPFERTLIVCDQNSFVCSLGCTSPPPPPDELIQPAEPQPLNAPVIELFCAAGAEIKHVTVQNWLEAGATADDEVEQEELLCNFVSQRGLCDGARSKITWTIVEAGSGVTWQHPAVVLKGDGSVGECFSVTLTNARQQADTGATMIHSGTQTRSRIVGKTISAGASQSCFRGVVNVEPWSTNARSQMQWDAILIGDHAESTSCPSVVARNTSAQIEGKGSTSRINTEQVFFFQQRGIMTEKAVPAILTGFCDAVLRELPHEFESEVREMVAMKIEESLKGSLSSSPLGKL